MMEILHPLPSGVENIPSPDCFTFPFCYEPHPLCIAAAEDIMPECRRLVAEEQERRSQPSECGKMFGVLVVSDAEGKRYYLSAFSGQILETYTIPGFVPPIYNLLSPTGYFRQKEDEISAISRRIEEDAENADSLREERKQRSQALQQWLFQQFNFLNARHESANLIDIFADQAPILSAQDYFSGHNRNKLQIKDNPSSRVPSGAGECCAPKLLQYAFMHDLIPLCMAEFWVGPAPKGELRSDGNFYPACSAKCKPILGHMLQGMKLDPSPFVVRNQKLEQQVQWLYKDDDIAVLYKPSGMLSVPGKDRDMTSLHEIVTKRYPDALYAHRLDMDTSGIIVFGLNSEAHKQLQEQFITHKVEKEYTAILDGHIADTVAPSGEIRLPLLPNPYDRPRQMVEYAHGKKSVTAYEIVERASVTDKNGCTRKYTLLRFRPHTGRTHQLRIHSAHPDGLNAPIIGDNLYGTPSVRLCLCASRLTLTHPTSGVRMTFEHNDFATENDIRRCIFRE